MSVTIGADALHIVVAIFAFVGALYALASFAVLVLRRLGAPPGVVAFFARRAYDFRTIEEVLAHALHLPEPPKIEDDEEDDEEDAHTSDARVTAALLEAERLAREGEVAASREAYLRASMIDEEIAGRLPADDPDGTVARADAIACALSAGAFARARELADRYAKEAKR